MLHIDHRDFYGGTVSSANLLQTTARWVGEQCKSDSTDRNLPSTSSISSQLSDFKVDLPSEEMIVVPVDITGTATVRLLGSTDTCSGHGNHEVVSVTRSSHRFHPVVFDYSMERATDESPDMSTVCHPAFIGYRKDKAQTISRLLQQNRQFSIDENPKLMFAYGKMVDAMLTSGVSSYIEFVSIEGIFFVRSKGSDRLSKGGPVDGVQIISVPCSKADLFKAKALSGVDKRKLMKLLQLAVDFGNSLKGYDSAYQNESTLVQGRALHRPQNTPEARSKLSDAEVMSEAELKNKPFSVFLTECGLTPELQDLVKYTMCLMRTADCSAFEGLEILHRHMYASGRLGETAFIYPIYGTTEIPESFCRSAAVRGTTYALRQGVVGLVQSKVPRRYFKETETITVEATREVASVGDKGVLYNSGVNEPSESVVCPGSPVDGQKNAVCETSVYNLDEERKPMLARSELDNVSKKDIAPVVAIILDGGQTISCDTVVLGALGCRKDEIISDCNSAATHDVLVMQVTGCFVCTGDLLLTVERGICVIPPFTAHLDNPYPIFLLQLNSSAMVCPRGCYLLYVMTLTTESSDTIISSMVQDIFEFLVMVSKTERCFNKVYFHVKVSPYESINDSFSRLGLKNNDQNPSNCAIFANSKGTNSFVMDYALEETEKAFSYIYPREDFFQGPILKSQCDDYDEEANILDI